MAVDMNSAIFELGEFPDEIILKVFASLDVKDLLNCGQVSKRFRTISHDEFLWQRIDLRGRNVSAAFIQFILDRGCKYLDLSNSRTLDLKSIQNIFKNCVQLTELNLECPNISIKESFLFYENRTPELKKIKIGLRYEEDSDEHIKILIERCNQLKELHLKYHVPLTDIALTCIADELKNTEYLDTFDLNLYSREKTYHSKLLQLPMMTKLANLNIRKKNETTRLKIELQSLNLYINDNTNIETFRI